jgi:hypothetical protein
MKKIAPQINEQLKLGPKNQLSGIMVLALVKEKVVLIRHEVKGLFKPTMSIPSDTFSTMAYSPAEAAKAVLLNQTGLTSEQIGPYKIWESGNRPPFYLTHLFIAPGCEKQGTPLLDKYETIDLVLKTPPDFIKFCLSEAPTPRREPLFTRLGKELATEQQRKDFCGLLLNR